MLFNALLLSSTALLARAANFDVTVGGLEGGNPVLKFNPEFVNAAVDDTVTFHFQQRNHSVVETSFNSVCRPSLNAQQLPVFATQFHPVSDTETEFPTEVYTVKDASKPLWFYCSQKSHCGKGMIFSINCPTTGDNSLDAFRQRALAIGTADAAASSSAAAWSSSATPNVYGGQTFPPVYHPTVTRTVTFQTETWTTTYESYENSPEPTPVAEDGVVHTVIVGGNGTLTYSPPSIQANVRDTVRFVFAAKNHTITQSSFGEPCSKLQTTASGQPGFDSGFIPGKADNSAFFDVKVNETGPIWAYCQQGNHCAQGMVFAINADESSARNYAAFQALAKTVGTTGSTGSPSGNGSPGAGYASASVVGGIATLVVGFGSIAAVLF